jgi:hypothetical protein
MPTLRTTLTLESDVVDLIERRIGETGSTFKDTVNDAIRSGLAHSTEVTPYVLPTVDMGHPRVDLTKALALASQLDDDVVTARLTTGR